MTIASFGKKEALNGVPTSPFRVYLILKNGPSLLPSWPPIVELLSIDLLRGETFKEAKLSQFKRTAQIACHLQTLQVEFGGNIGALLSRMEDQMKSTWNMNWEACPKNEDCVFGSPCCWELTHWACQKHGLPLGLLHNVAPHIEANHQETIMLTWGFPKIRGTFWGVPAIRTSILGSILGYSDFGKLPHPSLRARL